MASKMGLNLIFRIKKYQVKKKIIFFIHFTTSLPNDLTFTLEALPWGSSFLRTRFPDLRSENGSPCVTDRGRRF